MQAHDKMQMKYIEKSNQLTTLKGQLLEKEYKDNLEENLNIKMNELAQKLNQLEGGEKLSTIEIKEMLTMPYKIGCPLKYSNTELAELFEYYKKFISEINKVQKFIPTKTGFCGFIGIASTTYEAWKRSENIERKEIMQMIDDYITDVMLSLAQNGEIKEISTMFRAKSEHGFVEATAPVVIAHKTEINIGDIQKQIEAIKQGKSLKTIELKDDETYEEVDN